VAIGCLFAAIGSLAPVACQQLGRTRMASQRLVGLALASLAREGRRTAAMALAIGTTVCLATILAASVRSTHDGAVALTSRRAADRLAVSTLPFNSGSTVEAKTSPSVLTALARIPGVAGVSREISFTTGLAGSDFVNVVASERPTFTSRVVAGASGREAFAHGQVLVGSVLARRHHLRPGAPIVLDAPTGPVRLEVGGIWNDIDHAGRAVTVPMSVVTAHWGPQPPDQAYVTPASGVSLTDLAARIRAAHLDPDLRVATPSEVARATSDVINAYLGPFWTLQRALLIVAFLAVLSTLLLIGAQRQRELGTLAAVGMDPQAMRNLGIIEAVIVGVLGSALAAVAAAPMYEAFMNNALFLFGFRPPFRYDVTTPLVYGLVAIAVTLVAAAWPSWQMARTPVLDALRCE
jgi:putative ABC transport system permease protein